MDSYRDINGDSRDSGVDPRDSAIVEESVGHEPPVSPVGQDDRRMQVRAYNHWASLLGNQPFPSIEDLDPAEMNDFGPHSVLLDFTAGIDDPAVRYLGAKLAQECEAGDIDPADISSVQDVPRRSLLSRVTDHYMQILANQAPIGFEAEFVNQSGTAVLYRGILLPYSSNGDAIDFIYGVINWKELADQVTTDELMLEIDQALEASSADKPQRHDEPMEVWADGPLAESGAAQASVLDLSPVGAGDTNGIDLPEPDFGTGGPAADETMGLHDCLAAARELAQAARSSEDRTRSALYGAIGQAWDFALAAAEEPAEFAEIIADAGLVKQDRAPFTPVVKLVFGADYDKTRLTEYAAALGHAERLAIPRGGLSGFLAEAQGGLKGVVQAERRARKEASGQPASAPNAPREALAKKLRSLDPVDMAAIEAVEGGEFALLMARRLPDGSVMLLGEVPEDVAMIERAARLLIS